MHTQETPYSLLSLTTGLDNTRYISSEAGSTGYYYAEAKAGDPPVKGEKRVPLNIALVIDRSGSMAGEKLDHAKRAAKYVVDQLSSDDFVAIVQYDDDVQVVAPSTNASDKEALKRKIDQIAAGGYTNLSGGMEEGYAQVRRSYRSGAVNRVLLLSDGLANAGITDPAALQQIAKDRNLNQGMTISTFGLGLDYNETLMTNIAEHGSGNYYFIRNPEEIPAIFQKELNGLLNVVAQNATLHIDLPVGMQLVKVFGYTYTQVGQRISINFRDVFANETKAVLVKFVVAGNAPQYVIQASLGYDDPFVAAGSVSRKEQSASDQLVLAGSVEEFGKNIVERVKAQVVLFESNDKLEEAMRQVDAGNYSAAREIVQQNDDYLKMNESFVNASPELQLQVANNVSYQNQLSNVEALDASGRSAMQKSTRATNYDVRKKR